MTAKSSGTSLTTGHNSVSKVGAGPRLSIGTNPLLTSVSRQGTIQGGPAISYNSQQEFHGFCSQIFVAPTSLPHYLLNSLTKSANDPNQGLKLTFLATSNFTLVVLKFRRKNRFLGD